METRWVVGIGDLSLLWVGGMTRVVDPDFGMKLRHTQTLPSPSIVIGTFDGWIDKR